MGRVQPTDITKASVRVAQTSQCPVLSALRTEQIENPSSPSVEQQSFKFDPSTVSSWPIAADLGCTQFK